MKAIIFILFPMISLSAIGEMVPFVIPTEQSPSSTIALKPKPIDSGSPHIAVKNSHFEVSGERIRIWGVNNSFGANLPSHKDAERLATRMAAAGINSVRFHHMDTDAYPRGILEPGNPLKLSSEALDRLDYFVDQLARNGIYSNINLHVGRSVWKVLQLPDPHLHYDKIVGIFTPELVDAQKQYARDLLSHINKYRKIKYTDDPAIAFVEITNEDSFFMWDASRDLEELPEFYQHILRSKYSAWLKSKYVNDEGLRKAWSRGAEPLGQNMLAMDSFPKPESTEKGWRLEQHSGCIASIEKKSDGVMRVEICKADNVSWHIQVKQIPLAVKAGQYCTLSFRARADKPRSISYGLIQDGKPWGNLGAYGSVKLSNDWQLFSSSFLVSADENMARLNFSLSGDSTSIELAEVSLAPGGCQGLREDESIEKENVALFASSETEARTIDRYRFLADTEKAYFDEMNLYLKKELGLKALVTGTIVFGPCGLYAQSGMDYIDSHAYWQHPNFPGKPWDSNNWTVEQKAMVDNPADSTLPRIAAERMAGKPFTVSEYNHPAPNDYQAECVPMIAAYAAAQEWDGIWFYTYSHSSDDVDRKAYNSYFDIDANTAKWGFMRAGAAIFRDAGIPPLRRIRELGIGENGNPLTSMAKLHMKSDRNLIDAYQALLKDGENRFGLESMMRIKLTGTSTVLEGTSGIGPEISWIVNSKNHGTFYAGGPKAKILISHAMLDGIISTGGIEISSPGFAVLTMTSLDEKPLAESEKILISACGRCENTGMGYSEDRRTVGLKWGTSPVEIEAVTGNILLPDGKWTCHALNPDGTKKESIELRAGLDGKKILPLSPAHNTMWYLAENTKMNAD